MRNQTVTISKALAIMLMVLAHTRFSMYANGYINMFHMPLFLFMSGYCFKDIYVADSMGFVKRKIKGVYLPYVKYSLLFLFLHNLFFKLNIYTMGEYGFNGSVSSMYDLSEILYRMVKIIISMGGHEQLLGGFWFFKSLFFSSLIGLLVIRMTNKKGLSFFFGGGILFVCIILYKFNISVPVIGVGAREFFASFFFLCGYIYHKRGLYVESIYWIIPMGALSLVLGTFFWKANLLDMNASRVIPYACTALIGTVMIMSISEYICKCDSRMKRLLIYIGDNTFTILTWHFLCFKLVNLTIIAINVLDVKRLAEFPVIEEYSRKGWWVAYFCVGVFIPVLLLYIKTIYVRKRKHGYS